MQRQEMDNQDIVPLETTDLKDFDSIVRNISNKTKRSLLYTIFKIEEGCLKIHSLVFQNSEDMDEIRAVVCMSTAIHSPLHIFAAFLYLLGRKTHSQLMPN